jgi:hypothetical protein
MDLVSTSANKTAASRRPADPARRILFAVVTLCAAVLALVLPGAWSDQGTGTVVASAAAPSVPNSASAPVDMPRSSSDRGHSSRFFGFLEFDWDPDAPGGVPGFDPWPRP